MLLYNSFLRPMQEEILGSNVTLKQSFQLDRYRAGILTAEQPKGVEAHAEVLFSSESLASSQTRSPMLYARFNGRPLHIDLIRKGTFKWNGCRNENDTVLPNLGDAHLGV